MTITGGTITAINYTTISNATNASIIITGGMITATDGNTIYNYGEVEVSGTAQIDGTASIYPTIYNQANASAEITGGAITATNSNAIYNLANASVTITGGIITATRSNVINNLGTLNIGNANDTFSTTIPTIQGSTYGISSSSGTWNFYNGIIKGKTESYNKAPSQIRTNYAIAKGTETIEGIQYKTAYLAIPLKAEVSSVKSTTAFLGTGVTRDKINKISFVTSKEGHTADNTTCWDVSAVANSGAVLMWIANGDATNGYEIVIGSDDGVIANPDSTYLFTYIGYSNAAIIDLANLKTDNVTSMKALFLHCRNINILNLSGINTSNVTNMQDTFKDCQSLTTLDLSRFDVRNVETMLSMFNDCTNLSTLNISGWNTGKVKSMAAMFCNCENLTTLNLSGFNTNSLESMYRMFENCQRLTTLNISGWNTNKVTSTADMFKECQSLTTLNLSGFNTANVETMQSMFYNCQSLSTLNISGWNTGKVKNMGGMFCGCQSLTTLDLSGFDTSKNESMYRMFENCRNLTTLNISGINTGDLTGTGRMFNNCISLTTLDLSSFDTAKVTGMNEMFQNCSNLTTIYASSSFVTTAVTNSGNMFYNCTNLVGEAGTVYDANHIDKTYAHIDFGTSNPGYFTDKTRLTVTLDANGGTVSPATIRVSTGQPYGQLPIPTKDGYSFLGWKINGQGEYITEQTIVTQTTDHTLVAQWADNYYSITRNETISYYVTLADAFNGAQSGDTIVQEKSCTDSSVATLNNSKNIIFNNNNKTLTKTINEIRVDSGSTLEITGSGTITTSTNVSALIRNYGTLNITHTGTISDTYSGNGTRLMVNYGTLNKTGSGTITTSTQYAAIATVGGGTTSIAAGEVSASRNSTLHAYENSQINISGTAIITQANSHNAINLGDTTGTPTIGQLTMTGGTITAGGYGVVNATEGFINITEGTITAGQSGIHNNSGGTINVGKSNSELSTTIPAIRGETYGIEAGSGTWNFYNGIVKGQTAAYDKEPSAWRDNYNVVTGTETIEGKEYKTAYLEKSRTFTVTFDKNDASATGQMEPQVITYNRIEKLNLNKFSKTNYSFLEWNSKPDGSGTTYEDEEEVSNLDNITLYAQWTTKKAEVNGELCDTLQAAIGKVPTDGTQTTVTLLRDTSEALQVDSGKNIKFNLKNFTVSSNGSTNVIKNYGTIEIQNGTISISIAQGAINNYKNLTVSGGKILAPGGRQAIYNDNNSAVVTITGTAYLQSTSLERATVQNNKGTVNIIGGTIISDRMEAVKNSASGTLTIGTLDGDIDITNPVLQGATYGVTSAKAFKFYDGIVKGQDAAFDNEDMIPAGNREPDGIIIHNTEEIEGHDYDVAYLEIGKSVLFDPNGGQISQKDRERVVEPGNPIGELPKATKSSNILVGWFTDPSGGEQITAETIMGNTNVTYYAHWTAAVDAAKIGETKYNTLQAAINAVPANNTQKTITLLRDVYETVRVNQSQNIKFDFQSYKLENTVGASGDNANILNFGTILIENGLLTSDSEKVAVINNKSTGNLTVTGGRIIHRGQRQAIYNDTGTAEITGTAYLESSAPERGTVHNLNNGQLLITGGTIISKKQQAVNNVGSSFTLGIKDGIIDQTSPVLQGATYGLTNEKDTSREPTFNFYDGIIKGFIDTIFEVEETSTIIDIETGAQQVDDSEYIEGKEYKTTYLQPSRGLMAALSRRPTVIGANSITITLNTLAEGASSRTATIEYDSGIVSNKKAGFGSTLEEAINNANEATATTVTVTGSGYVYAEGIDSEGNTIASSLQVE